MMTPRALPGWTVSIDRVLHASDLIGPPDRPHVFVYFITITNESKETITIKGRKWVIREENGNTIAVEGDGVVGEFPRLEPGGRFSYNSSHAAASDAVAEGAYLGITDSGEPVFTRIPRFEMRISAS